jgi:DNA-binding NarL/FixJ family response regulator
MQDGPRVLVAAALGKIIEPLLRQSLSDAMVRVAENQAAVERAVSDRLRFDVVVADLTWNDHAIEYSFDGLDVLNLVRSARRPTPVIFAAQGHGLERDHLDEAVEQPEVAGIYRKAMGPGPLIEAINIAVKGGNLTTPRFPSAAARRTSRGFMLTSGRAKGSPQCGWPGRSPQAGPLITRRWPARHMSATTPRRSSSTISVRSSANAASTAVSSR